MPHPTTVSHLADDRRSLQRLQHRILILVFYQVKKCLDYSTTPRKSLIRYIYVTFLWFADSQEIPFLIPGLIRGQYIEIRVIPHI